MSDDAPKKGRPSAYRPEFCETAVAFLSQGYSTTALAGEIGVGRATIYRWADEHSEFQDALKAGQAMGVRVWEDRLARVAEKGGGPGTATAIIFALKNRGQDDWREKTDHNHTSDDGSMSPQRVEIVAAMPQDDDG